MQQFFWSLNEACKKSVRSFTVYKGVLPWDFGRHYLPKSKISLASLPNLCLRWGHQFQILREGVSGSCVSPQPPFQVTVQK